MCQLVGKASNFYLVSFFDWREKIAFVVSHFESKTVRIQSNTFIRTQNSVVVQTIQIETGIIFLRDLRGVFL